jgi:hypothetical protein
MEAIIEKGTKNSAEKHEALKTSRIQLFSQLMIFDNFLMPHTLLACRENSTSWQRDTNIFYA